MKHYYAVFFLSTIIVNTAYASKESINPRIAIQEIQDRSAGNGAGGCDYGRLWSSPGDAVREVLTDELTKLGGLTLVEREHIGKIFEEEMNHENLDATTVAKRKKFVAANLAVAGTISEFEWCVGSDGQKLNVGGLFGVPDIGVGRRTNKAHVAIDLRLIEVETGKILKTFRSTGAVDESGFSVSVEAFGSSLDVDTFNRTPLGQATRSALADAAKQIRAAALQIK